MDPFYEPLFESELEWLASLYESSMLAASNDTSIRIQSLLDTIDVLEMHSMLSLFEQPETCLSIYMDEVSCLRKLINNAERHQLGDLFDKGIIMPPLSCKDRMLYESIVPLAVVDLQACKAAAQTGVNASLWSLATASRKATLPSRERWV